MGCLNTITLTNPVQEALLKLSAHMGLKKSSLISFLILEKAKQEKIIVDCEIKEVSHT